jgi:hypothetical protein
MTDSDRCRQHSRAEYYRRRGIEAQQRAARATEPKIKDAFEDVASGWFVLAEQVEWLESHRPQKSDAVSGQWPSLAEPARAED